MNTKTLTYEITIKTDPHSLFAYVSDWERQSEWILFTNVKIISLTPHQVDTVLVASTSLGPLSVVDTMIVTEWIPLKQISIEHTGRIILGKGIFSIKRNRCNALPIYVAGNHASSFRDIWSDRLLPHKTISEPRVFHIAPTTQVSY